MRICITGICGFAGSEVAKSLREHAEGCEIFGIDNFSRPGSERNREGLRAGGIPVHHGDVRCAADLETLPRADWLIDAAANPSVLAGVGGTGSSRQTVEQNVVGTLNALEYCRRHGAGLVLLSSSRVYSIAGLRALPLRVRNQGFDLDAAARLPEGVSAEGIEAGFPADPPVSLYGATKLASEILAQEYADAFGLPLWIERCGVLAGAGQFGTPEQGIFSYWIHAHRARRPMRYMGFEGTGYQSRDALHPRDLAELLLRQMSCGRTGGRRLYTVGGGPENLLSLAQLTAWCDARFGAHGVTADAQPRRYDVPWIAMSNRAAGSDFGWARQTPLKSILEEIATHAEHHPDWLSVSGVE